MRSTCLDEYQHAVGWHYDLFLFGRNRWILVLAQGFLDLLLDFQQGGFQRGGLCGNFGEVRNMGGAAVCRECTKHRILSHINANALDDYGGKTNIAFCQACGKAFIKRGSRQKYCGTLECQSVRNKLKSKEYYYRERAKSDTK